MSGEGTFSRRVCSDARTVIETVGEKVPAKKKTGVRWFAMSSHNCHMTGGLKIWERRLPIGCPLGLVLPPQLHGPPWAGPSLGLTMGRAYPLRVHPGLGWPQTSLALIPGGNRPNPRKTLPWHSRCAFDTPVFEAPASCGDKVLSFKFGHCVF